MKNSIKNHDIIISAQNGSQKAINQIYALYCPMVTKFVSIKINKRSVSVEDAVIVTMGKALININSFDMSHEFSTWILKIAENVCIDELRKTKHQMLSINASDNTEREFAEHISDNSLLPDQRIEKDEKISTLLLAIEKLSKNQRKCLLMQIEGFSIREIALETQLNENNIKTLLSRAKEKLSKMQLS